MINKPQPHAGVMQIAQYQPGESALEGQSRIIKLASNESPLGASPRVKEAILAHLETPERYPDGAAKELRQAIAAAQGLKSSEIVTGNGSEQIIQLLTRAYAGPGDEVIQTEYGFLVYRIAAMAAGAKILSAKDKNFTADVDAILALVTDRTKIVFIANPNNPTGTHIPASEMARLRQRLPSHVLLVIDAAYAEYVTDEAYSDGADLVKAAIDSGADNVVMTRTFSKIYGLASMRIGWAYLPESIAGAINRIREVFNVTSLSQAAGIVAVQDQDHIRKAKAFNAEWLPKVTHALEDMGIPVLPSQGNFILACFAGGEAESEAADAHLRADGIIVRPVGGYGLPDCLRITIGTEAENEALINSLKNFRAGR